MKTKICPRCQHENPESALACARCGTLFTVQIALEKTHIVFPTPNNFQAVAIPIEEAQHTLFLYIMGDKQPIILKNIREITLGRFTPDTTPPTVELAVYGDNRLGVSRKHAIIEYSGKDYLLRDLGSSNGTWLNEVQLIPHRNYVLKPNDRVRLAQLPMIVHFKENHAPETAFYLTYSDAQARFYPSDVARDVIPFLQALEGVQEVLDAAFLKPDRNGMRLKSLQVESSVSRVMVATEGGSEAVQYVNGKVNVWKRSYQNLLDGEQNIETEVVERELAAPLFANLEQAEAKPYLDKVVSLLPTILFSPLELSSA